MGSLYALVAAGVLALGCYALYQRSEAADARADAAEHLASQFKQDLAQSEADKAALKSRSRQLDETVKARDVRVGVLENEKRAIKGELENIKRSVGKEDQSCLDRALPDAFAERLLDGSDSHDKDGKGDSPGKSSVAVPEVLPPR